MRTRYVADAILYTEDGKILFQDRTSISKDGEKYSLFGGGIDSGESAEQAMIREMKEELNIDVDTFELLGVFECPVSRPQFDHLHCTTFLVQCPPLEEMTVLEGDGMKLMTPDQARKENIHALDYEMLDAFEKWWKSR